MEYLEFDKILERNTFNYKGDHDTVITRSAELYRLICDLIIDDDLTKSVRARLFAVIGYFIIPQDLYPEEEHGPIGYVDDLMLVIFVLRDIREVEGVGKLYYHWKSERVELDNILDTEFESLVDNYTDLYQELIEFMGF
tara:strand:+ start:45 stop:461 length:417 start_codon:yes stop_codon:yes gene_type:complete